MTTYLINTPICTAYGDFRFTRPITPEAARRRLKDGFKSAIDHPDVAAFLSALLALDVPAKRISIAMQPGDCALVLQLREQLPQGRVLSAAEVARVPFELAWLERLP